MPRLRSSCTTLVKLIPTCRLQPCWKILPRTARLQGDAGNVASIADSLLLNDIDFCSIILLCKGLLKKKATTMLSPCPHHRGHPSISVSLRASQVSTPAPRDPREQWLALRIQDNLTLFFFSEGRESIAQSEWGCLCRPGWLERLSKKTLHLLGLRAFEGQRVWQRVIWSIKEEARSCESEAPWGFNTSRMFNQSKTPQIIWGKNVKSNSDWEQVYQPPRLTFIFLKTFIGKVGFTKFKLRNVT